MRAGEAEHAGEVVEHEPRFTLEDDHAHVVLVEIERYDLTGHWATHFSVFGPALQRRASFVEEKEWAMSELVVGILLAILASTVIPWVTSLASSWLEARRDLKNRRRELFEKAFVTNVRDNFQSPAVETEERMRDIQARNDEANAALGALRSSFGLFDRTVEKVAFEGWTFRNLDDPQFEVLRLWANGHTWVARWKARKLMMKKSHISSAPTQPR